MKAKHQGRYSREKRASTRHHLFGNPVGVDKNLTSELHSQVEELLSFLIIRSVQDSDAELVGSDSLSLMNWEIRESELSILKKIIELSQLSKAKFGSLSKSRKIEYCNSEIRLLNLHCKNLKSINNQSELLKTILQDILDLIEFYMRNASELISNQL
jgi:hypothetical protein